MLRGYFLVRAVVTALPADELEYAQGSSDR